MNQNEKAPVEAGGPTRGQKENEASEKSLTRPTDTVNGPGVNMLSAALACAAKSKAVFPCGIDKKPLTAHGFKDATTNPVQIRAWWAQCPDASIGMPTGAATGVFVLDMDLPDGPASIAKLEAQHGPMDGTLTQQTGGGGSQFFFVLPEGRKVKNSASKIGPGLDIRGEGGYVILPPSAHPSGGQYEWTNKRQPAEAPAWLLEMVCERPMQSPGNRPKTDRQEQPPAAGTTPYGSKALKDEAAKVAGTAKGSRNHAANQAGFVIGQLVAGGELDRGEAEAVLLDSAIRAGLSEAEARKTLESGMKAGERQPRTAPEKAREPEAAKTETQTAIEKPCAPVPFDTESPPPIPPGIMPGVLYEFPRALAETVQVPFELALINALGTVAVAVQRKIRVQIREGYAEPLNIYALCALPPGERKSAVVEACKRPLVEWQSAKRREMADAIKDAESERKSMEKAIDAKRSKIALAADQDLRRAAIAEIKDMEREIPEVPVSPRFLADDFTPEALAVLMERHKERIGVLEAEGGLFDILAGRYSNGVPNLDAVLKFWSGEPCQIDRKGREAIYLHDPHLTLCISPQPEIIRGLADKPGFRGRGLIGRFLYVMPESRLGGRLVETKPVPFDVSEAWRQTVLRLLSLPWALNEHGEEVAFIVQLDRNAYALWRQFAEEVETELRSGGEFEYMTDWAGKFPGQAVRLAGLIHCCTVTDPHRTDIGPDTMRAAVDMAAILADHAKAAYSLMGSDPGQECAKSILRWIERDHVEQFTARDALRAVRGRFPVMEAVNSGLSILGERGFIFPEEKLKSGPGRRPSPGYTVNPQTWGV